MRYINKRGWLKMNKRICKKQKTEQLSRMANIKKSKSINIGKSSSKITKRKVAGKKSS